MKARTTVAFWLWILIGFSAVKAAAENEVAILPPGPWGTIECSHFFLEVPDSYLRSVPAPSGQTVWRFPLSSYPDPFATVASILEEDPELFRELDDTCTVVKTGEEMLIYPTDDVVVRLSPTQRLSLYRELGKWAQNRHHARPIRIESEDPVEWFDREGISPETRDAVAALAFRRGDSFFFSDVPLAILLARSPVEEISLRKAFSRTRTMILNVRAPVSDRDSFISYWSAEGRLPIVVPVVTSIANLERPSTVPLFQLLPPVAKKHLYSYPSFGMVMEGVFPGSWWTSANFMRFDPDPELRSRTSVLDHFESTYESIEENAPRLPGDVILLIDRRTGRAVHSCVHIAADVVFTKRNNALSSPWVLSSLDRVRAGMINQRHIDFAFKRLVEKPHVAPMIGKPKRSQESR